MRISNQFMNRRRKERECESYQSPEPATAISLAKEHNLRWSREAKLDLQALRLMGEYSKVLDEIGTLRSLTPDEADERSTALMMHWTRLIKDHLDPRELAWQYQVWPQLKPPKRRTTAMYPVCRAVHGAAALYLFVPHGPDRCLRTPRQCASCAAKKTATTCSTLRYVVANPLSPWPRVVLSAVTTAVPCARCCHDTRPIGGEHDPRERSRQPTAVSSVPNLSRGRTPKRFGTCPVPPPTAP